MESELETLIPNNEIEVVDLISDDENSVDESQKDNNGTVIGDADSTQGSQNDTGKVHDAFDGAKRVSVDLSVDDDSTDNNAEVHSSTKEEKQPYSIASKHLTVRDLMLTNEKLANTFKCAGKYCTFTSRDAENFCIHIQKHLRSSQNDDDFLNCCYCVFRPRDRNAVDLLTHVYSEHGHCQFSCPSCFFVAASKSVVQAHRKEVHADDSDAPMIKFVPANGEPGACVSGVLPQNVAVQKYECPVGTRPSDLEHSVACGFKAYKSKSLVQHISRTHRHERDFVCGVQDCSQRYESIGELVKHHQQHEMCQYQCAYCVKGEVGETEMLVHFARVHPGKAPKAYCRYLIEEVSHGATKDESSIMLIDNDLAPATFVSDAHESIADQEAIRACNLENLLHRASTSTSTAKYIVPKSKIKTEPDLDELYKKYNSEKLSITVVRIPVKSETRDSTDSAVVAPSLQSPMLSPAKQTMDVSKDYEQPKNCIQQEVVSQFFVNTPPTDPTKKILPHRNLIFQTKRSVSDCGTEKHTKEPTAATEDIPVMGPPKQSSKYHTAASQPDNRLSTKNGKHFEDSALGSTVGIPVMRTNDTSSLSKYNNKTLSADSLENVSHTEKELSVNYNPLSAVRFIVPIFIPSHQRYICGSFDCAIIYDSLPSLRNHLISSHVAESRFRCKICKPKDKNNDKENRLTLAAYLLHVRMHGEKLFLCRICNYIHFRKQAMYRHAKKHGNSGAAITLVRDMQITEPQSDHLIKHFDSEVLQCTICNFVGNKLMMIRHTNEKHPELNYNNNSSRGQLLCQPSISDLLKLRQRYLQRRKTCKKIVQSRIPNDHISKYNNIMMYKQSKKDPVSPLSEENHGHLTKNYSTNLDINNGNNLDHSRNGKKVNKNYLSAFTASSTYKITIDSLVDSLVCPFCPRTKKLSNGKLFVHHIAVHYSMKGFKCGHCKYKESVGGVYAHQKMCHREKPRLVLINNDLEVLPVNSDSWLRLLKKFSRFPKIRKNESCGTGAYIEQTQVSNTQNRTETIKNDTYIEIEISSEMIPPNVGSVNAENMSEIAKVIEPIQIPEHRSEEDVISSTKFTSELIQSTHAGIGTNVASDKCEINKNGELANAVQSIQNHTNRATDNEQIIEKDSPSQSKIPTIQTSIDIIKSNHQLKVNTTKIQNIDKREKSSFYENEDKINEVHPLSKRQKKVVSFDSNSNSIECDDIISLTLSAVTHENTNETQQNLEQSPHSVKVRKMVARKSTSKLPISLENIKFNAKYGLEFLKKQISTNMNNNR